MELLIKEPHKKNFLLTMGIWLSEKITGKKMMPARLLAWSPRLAVGAAFFETMVVHHDKTLSPRLLKLLRMQVSFFVACPFCVDMNSFEKEKFSITTEEIRAMQGQFSLTEVRSFSQKEMIALEFSKGLSQTPPAISQELTKSLKQEFDDREILILTATASQVNYWARLIQSLGISPAGFDPKQPITTIDMLTKPFDKSK